MNLLPFFGKGRKKEHSLEAGPAEVFSEDPGLGTADQKSGRKRGEKFPEAGRKNRSFKVKMGQAGLIDGVDGRRSQVVSDKRQSIRKTQELQGGIREGPPEGPHGRKG
jgi:hypothetical protein